MSNKWIFWHVEVTKGCMSKQHDLFPMLFLISNTCFAVAFLSFKKVFFLNRIPTCCTLFERSDVKKYVIFRINSFYVFNWILQNYKFNWHLLIHLGARCNQLRSKDLFSRPFIMLMSQEGAVIPLPLDSQGFVANIFLTINF